jgi:hypothetical protein
MTTTPLYFVAQNFNSFNYQGSFFHCNDFAKLTEVECHGTFYKYEGRDLTIAQRKWTNYKFHFDNVLHGMETLFTVTTFEGWPT